MQYSSLWALCTVYKLLVSALRVSQAEVCGPTIAYVDDAAAMEAQLKQLLPSLQHVLADVLHVMKRVNETLTPHHPKTGETGSFEQCTTRVLC
jgi:hypothetical protein